MLLQAEVSDYQVYPGLSEPAVFIAAPGLQGGRGHRGRDPPDRQQASSTGSSATTTGWARRARPWWRPARATSWSSSPRCGTTPRPRSARRVRMGENRATAMQRAVKGERGYGPAIDYRGVPVMAAWSYLPVVPLGPGGQAGPGRGLRADRPAAAGHAACS